MALTVLAVNRDKQIAKKDGGTYPGTELVLQSASGKPMVKALHKTILDNNKALAGVVAELQPGDVIELITEKSKDGKFNNVKAIVKATDDDESFRVAITKHDGVQATSAGQAQTVSTFKSFKGSDNTGMQVGNALNVAGALLSGKKESSVQALEDMAMAVLRLSNSLKARLEAGEFDPKPTKSKFDDIDV